MLNCFVDGVDPDQFDPVVSFDTLKVVVRNNDALESEFRGLLNPLLNVTDGPDLSAEADLADGD
jgi:hypothetical protein